MSEIQHRTAEVLYDRDTGRLTVRLDVTDDEPPTDFYISGVTVVLAYPDTSSNYGVRRFGRPEVEETCGDCIEGRCHFGGAGPLPGEECGCERHEASVRAR